MTAGPTSPAGAAMVELDEEALSAVGAGASLRLGQTSRSAKGGSEVAIEELTLSYEGLDLG